MRDVYVRRENLVVHASDLQSSKVSRSVNDEIDFYRGKKLLFRFAGRHRAN